MQLFVLGPAFGLPSIDAECIAAVAYLRSRRAAGWTVVPTHDRTRRLPCLAEGDEIVEGFANIARHLEREGGDVSSKSPLDAKQRADATALTSFLDANAQTLLDISLYVSYENYTTTRSAFTKILPWHANYTLPPSRRSEARARTAHLGISSIDVDDVHEDLSGRTGSLDTSSVGKEQGFEPEAQKRASLLLPAKKTVRSLLQRPEHAAVFKLHALADNFFEPLRDMLGDEKYLLGTEDMQAVDCLAFGYLSLMLYPTLPHDWLAKTMRTKYPSVVRYTERLSQTLDVQTKVEDVVSLRKCKRVEEANELRSSCGMKLPWEPPTPTGVVDAATTIIHDMLSRIPLLHSDTSVVATNPVPRSFSQRYLPAFLGAAAASLGFFGYSAFASGLLKWPHGEEMHIFGRKRLADYGHLGAALAGFSLLGQQATRDATYYRQEAADSPVQVEVQVEKDGHP